MLIENHILQKLNRLNDLLEQTYGLTIDFNNSEEDLRNVFEHYNEQRKFIIERGSSNLHENKQYTKAVLITESIRIFLREIAPKRIRKKSGAKK